MSLFFRLHFFFTHNVLFCHSKSLTFKAFFVYSFFPATPDALLNKQSYHERPQRPGNDTRAVALCARFRENGANKASKEMDFSRWCGDKLFNKEKESEMVFWCFVGCFLCMHNAQSPRHESRLKQTACGCVICKY